MIFRLEPRALFVLPLSYFPSLWVLLNNLGSPWAPYISQAKLELMVLLSQPPIAKLKQGRKAWEWLWFQRDFLATEISMEQRCTQNKGKIHCWSLTVDTATYQKPQVWILAAKWKYSFYPILPWAYAHRLT